MTTPLKPKTTREKRKRQIVSGVISSLYGLRVIGSKFVPVGKYRMFEKDIILINIVLANKLKKMSAKQVNKALSLLVELGKK